MRGPQVVFQQFTVTSNFEYLQGMLPLTFSDKADYDKIKPDDLMTLNDLANLSPGRVSNDFFLVKVQYSYTINI